MNAIERIKLRNSDESRRSSNRSVRRPSRLAKKDKDVEYEVLRGDSGEAEERKKERREEKLSGLLERYVVEGEIADESELNQLVNPDETIIETQKEEIVIRKSKDTKTETRKRKSSENINKKRLKEMQQMRVNELIELCFNALKNRHTNTITEESLGKAISDLRLENEEEVQIEVSWQENVWVI